MQQKIDTIISDIDAITLQEEVIDKKISNVIKSQDSVKNELEEAKKQKNALSSEILDLELSEYIHLLELKFISSILYGFLS